MTEAEAPQSMRRLGQLSYSQLSTYAECGEQYRLTKGYRLGARDWWATAAGSAIHQLTERYDLGNLTHAQMVDGFPAELDKEVESRGGEGNLQPSGRVTKEITWSGSPTKKDRSWWLHWAPEILNAYVAWRDSTEWEVAMILGKDGVWPGVELRFATQIGVHPVRGSIDRIFWDPAGERYVIVDLKTGAREPGGRLQLATYRLALERETGMRVDHAAYSQPVIPRGASGVVWKCYVSDMSAWHEDWMDNLYTKAAEGIARNIFLPNTNACAPCPVAEFCVAKEGDLMGAIPTIEPAQDLAQLNIFK